MWACAFPGMSKGGTEEGVRHCDRYGGGFLTGEKCSATPLGQANFCSVFLLRKYVPLKKENSPIKK